MTQIVSPGMQAGAQTFPQRPAMETIGPEVTAFTQAHWRPAVETLVQAFAEEAVAAHLLPNHSKRPAGRSEASAEQRTRCLEPGCGNELMTSLTKGIAGPALTGEPPCLLNRFAERNPSNAPNERSTSVNNDFVKGS